MEILSLADVELRFQIENSVSELLVAYYEVARLARQVRLQEETIDLSKRRLDQLRTRFSYGQGNSLDILNAEVDLQRDSINFVTLQQQVKNGRRNLNFLMGRDVNTPFQVDTVLNLPPLQDLESLLSLMRENNVQVLLNEKNVDVTEMNFDIIEASGKPTLSAGAGFDFTYQDNAPGSFITSSNSRGVTVGLTVNWNLFDGGLRNVQRQSNQLDLELLSIQKDQLLAQLERDIVNAWDEYQTALLVIQAEQANLETNEANYERTEELYNVGQVTSVEYRQAQLNLLIASTSLNSARYDLKAIEIRIHLLTGQLMTTGY